MIGEIYDVIVVIRQISPSFKKLVRVIFLVKNHHMPWVPPGFVHGFQVVSDTAEIVCQITVCYRPEGGRSLLWNDSGQAIKWPIGVGITEVSARRYRTVSPISRSVRYY